MKAITASLPAVFTLRPEKRDTVLTALLLFDVGNPDLRTQYLESIRRDWARIDEELVLRLFSGGDDKAKLAIARSIAVSRMRPRAFRKIFDSTYSRRDISARQRWDLVWNLEHFLYLNPRQARAYERVILELARSPNLDLRVRGISMAAQFGRVDDAMLALFRRGLRSRSPHVRLTTVNAFSHLVDRLAHLAPRVRDFVTSDSFRDEVARMHRADSDEDVRTGSRNLLRRLPRTAES